MDAKNLPALATLSGEPPVAPAAPADERAALVADAPLRVVAHYFGSGGFLPGREGRLRVDISNPGGGIVPLQVRFRAPKGWSLARSGTDVEHALGPGETQTEELALVPPAAGGGGALRVELRSGVLSWAVEAGLPLAAFPSEPVSPGP